MTSIPIAEPTDTSTAVRPALVVTPTAPGGGSRRARPGRVLAWVALGAVLGATLFPFWWVVRAGLSNTRELTSNAGLFLPVDLTLGAFRRVLGVASTQDAVSQGGSGASLNFWLFLRNSVVVATLITAGQVFFSAM